LLAAWSAGKRPAVVCERSKLWIEVVRRGTDEVAFGIGCTGGEDSEPPCCTIADEVAPLRGDLRGVTHDYVGAASVALRVVARVERVEEEGSPARQTYTAASAEAEVAGDRVAGEVEIPWSEVL